MAYSVLVVAPHTDMPLGDAQVQAIINSLSAVGIQVDTLLGHVSLVGFRERVTARPRNGLFFVIHGDETGWMLSDGILTWSNLATMLRGNVQDFCFLNSCSSLVPAAHLAKAALDTNGDGPDFVATRATLPDVTAYITAATFAAELAKHRNHRRAYAMSLPGDNQEYVCIPALSRAFLATAGERV